jgi:DMSO/TMAO reductase YedYZ molybdopterin-dependent catalytic subunit
VKRRLLLGAAGAGLLARSAQAERVALDPRLPQGLHESAAMEALPGKAPLIRLSSRPPNYETPISAFRTAITPNNQFFVRYHLSGLPEQAELARDWKLRVEGDAAGQPVEFSLAALKQLPAAEVVAVCQCSGNRRGLFQPHVPGVEWGLGAMGNARWQGVRLRDVLARAGVKPEAVELFLEGADGPPVPETPDYQKSIPIARALRPDTILAFAMNGEPLPLTNGYPVRVIVPGWTATYWMKHVTKLTISAKPMESFWMKAAYRVPRGLFATDAPFTTQQTAANEPITRILVNSLVANLKDGDRVASSGFSLGGVAWDGGAGIERVELSTDGGKQWRLAALGENLGRYSFRRWFQRIQAPAGPLEVRVRAVSRSGEMQVDRLVSNPAGYHHNVVQALRLVVA